MRPLELTRSGIVGTVGIFAVAAVCIRLGFWQLDRREARLERNAAVAERLAEPPVDLGAAPLDTAGLTHRRARAAGVYDPGRTLVIAGRSYRGAPGVHVYAPLRVGGGAVLVNRGWLPAADAATVDLAPVAVDTPVVLTGVLLPLPRSEAAPTEEAFRTTWFRVDADAIRGQYPYPVSPLYLQLERGAAGGAAAGGSPVATAPTAGTGAGRTAPLPLPPPALDAGPHLSYALQWFGFALVFLIGWAALVMRRGRGATPGA